MKKTAIVYWSGTGNTEQMAQLVAGGVRAAGGEADVVSAADFSAAALDSYDTVAFGCPAMGAEELEDSEFAPMFDTCLPALGGRTIALFGSYGWGDGQWMRDWEAQCLTGGAVLACESVICNDAPDADGEAACAAMGAALVQG